MHVCRHVLVALTMLALAAAGSGQARAADQDVRINSIGYLPARAKHVSVLGGGADFVVRRAADDSAAFTAPLGPVVMDVATGDMVASGDFSALDEPGQFYVDVAGVGRSGIFAIGDDVMRAPFSAAMLGFRGLRCGAPVSFTYEGTDYGHAACHLGDGHVDYLGLPGVAAGTIRDGRRGWHDAGDYGKYTGNGAFTLGMLLSGWERHQDVIGLVPITVPEGQGAAVPAYLEELTWELDWLLTMQYGSTDGRVSHKLTRTVFEAFIAPEADDGIRFFVPYGTAATADFVAALAQASRVFAPYDPERSARFLAAARVSYAYLDGNPANVPADQTGFTTGGYGTTDPDDRLWAAAEMWETTGDAAALADVELRIRALTATVVDADFDWGNVKNLGLFTYLLSQRPGRDPALVDRVRASALAAADAIVATHDESGYGRGVRRFYWGSNGSVARTAMVLDLAHGLTDDPTYLDAAIDQLGYLFGRNQYNRCHVTGLGSSPPVHPHHRPSASDAVAAPYPGLLVGGGTTALNWVDDQNLYMVNEIAVNWNGALVYALALFLPSTRPPAAADAGSDAAPADAADGSSGGDAGGGETGTGGRAGGGCGCGVAAARAASWPGLGGSALMLAIGLRVRRRRRGPQRR